MQSCHNKSKVLCCFQESYISIRPMKNVTMVHEVNHAHNADDRHTDFSRTLRLLDVANTSAKHEYGSTSALKL